VPVCPVTKKYEFIVPVAKKLPFFDKILCPPRAPKFQLVRFEFSLHNGCKILFRSVKICQSYLEPDSQRKWTLVPLWLPLRIDPLRFQARGRKRQPNLGFFSFSLFYVILFFVFLMRDYFIVYFCGYFFWFLILFFFSVLANREQ